MMKLSTMKKLSLACAIFGAALVVPSAIAQSMYNTTFKTQASTLGWTFYPTAWTLNNNDGKSLFCSPGDNNGENGIFRMMQFSKSNATRLELSMKGYLLDDNQGGDPSTASYNMGVFFGEGDRVARISCLDSACKIEASADGGNQYGSTYFFNIPTVDGLPVRAVLTPSQNDASYLKAILYVDNTYVGTQTLDGPVSINNLIGSATEIGLFYSAEYLSVSSDGTYSSVGDTCLDSIGYRMQ